MITFDDIKFKPHRFGDGLHGLIFFPNGYGLSVVNYKSIGIGSYTLGDDDWEVAIIKGNKDNWEITYDTLITNDVLGYQTKEDINKLILSVIRFC
jgi:hypothetical protein